MTKLYIGNCTQQVVDFSYRLSESNGVRRLIIPAGGQVSVSGEAHLSSEHCDEIIEHHTRYGLTNLANVENKGDFSGLCYSIDKPITGDRLARAMDKRQDVLETIGHETRKGAAIAVNTLIRDTLSRPENHGLGEVRTLDLSVEERDVRGRPTGEHTERYKVDRGGDDGPVARGRGRPRKVA